MRAGVDNEDNSEVEDVETDRLLPSTASGPSPGDDDFCAHFNDPAVAHPTPSSRSSLSTSADRAIHVSLHVHFTLRVCLYLGVAAVLIVLCAATVLQLSLEAPASTATAVTAAVVDSAAAPADIMQQLYTRWLPFCNSTQQNVVLHRNDAENYVGGEQERVWSVTNYTFHTAQPHCQSTQQLLDALHYGQRHPVPGHEFNSSGRERAQVEWAQSWFEPSGCSLRWYESDEICGIFDRFSHVVMAGDSLSRHVNQGLYMLMTDDLRYGGLPRLSRQKGLFDRCQCDGQFSEHSVCREYEWNNMHDLNDTRIYGVCTHTNHNTFTLLTLQTYEGAYPTGSFQTLCSPDPRPRFVLIQGHAHYKTELRETMRRFINPLLEAITTVRNTCPTPFKLYLVLASATAQSRLLDRQFPHQSRERVTEYNTAMEVELLSRGSAAVAGLVGSVGTIHYWNLTLNAATSDGFHYLSDVNLVRANTVINYMALLNTTTTAGT